MILAHADVFAGKHLGAALAHQNSAGFGPFAIIEFNTQVFGFGIP